MLKEIVLFTHVCATVVGFVSIKGYYKFFKIKHVLWLIAKLMFCGEIKVRISFLVFQCYLKKHINKFISICVIIVRFWILELMKCY